MAKFTALLLAASVLVLSIALLYLGGETHHIREQPPWQERLFVRVSPHCFYSRRAYASQVATSIPAFSAPLHTTRGFLGGTGPRELGAVFQRCRHYETSAEETAGLIFAHSP